MHGAPSVLARLPPTLAATFPGDGFIFPKRFALQRVAVLREVKRLLCFEIINATPYSNGKGAHPACTFIDNRALDPEC